MMSERRLLAVIISKKKGPFRASLARYDVWSICSIVNVPGRSLNRVSNAYVLVDYQSVIIAQLYLLMAVSSSFVGKTH